MKPVIVTAAIVEICRRHEAAEKNSRAARQEATPEVTVGRGVPSYRFLPAVLCRVCATPQLYSPPCSSRDECRHERLYALAMLVVVGVARAMVASLADASPRLRAASTASVAQAPPSSLPFPCSRRSTRAPGAMPTGAAIFARHTRG